MRSDDAERILSLFDNKITAPELARILNPEVDSWTWASARANAWWKLHKLEEQGYVERNGNVGKAAVFVKAEAME